MTSKVAQFSLMGGAAANQLFDRRDKKAHASNLNAALAKKDTEDPVAKLISAVDTATVAAKAAANDAAGKAEKTSELVNLLTHFPNSVCQDKLNKAVDAAIDKAAINKAKDEKTDPNNKNTNYEQIQINYDEAVTKGTKLPVLIEENVNSVNEKAADAAKKLKDTAASLFDKEKQKVEALEKEAQEKQEQGPNKDTFNDLQQSFSDLTTTYNGLEEKTNRYLTIAANEITMKAKDEAAATRTKELNAFNAAALIKHKSATKQVDASAGQAIVDAAGPCKALVTSYCNLPLRQKPKSADESICKMLSLTDE